MIHLGWCNSSHCCRDGKRFTCTIETTCMAKTYLFFFFFEKPPYSGRGQRRILNARDPPRITCIHHEYEMVNNNKCTTITENNDMVHWSFFFGPKEMRSIRKHLPPQLQTCSTFEILTAFLWKCRTIALEFDPNDVV